MRPWLGDGVFTSNGSKWRRRRKMIIPSFHLSTLQDFQEIMQLHSAKFVKMLSETAKSGRAFDFQHLVHYLTIDIICGMLGKVYFGKNILNLFSSLDTAMGVPLNIMDSQNPEFISAIQ